MSEASKRIRHILTEQFQPEFLHIEDESWKHAGHAGAEESGGGHFVIEIRAAVFSGLSRMQQHRMVMEALKPLFPATIHAASIRSGGCDR